jgi:hypothetical protein
LGGGLLVFFIGSVAAASGAGETAPLVQIVMAGLAIGGALWWRSWRKKADSRILQQAFLAYRDRIAADGFVPDYVHIAPSGRSFIAIDETRGAVKVGGGDEASQGIAMRRLRAEQILGASIAEKGQGSVTAVLLMLALDDMAMPFIGVNFLDRKAKRNTAPHRQAQADARLWQTRVELLRRRSRQPQASENKPGAASVETPDPGPET